MSLFEDRSKTEIAVWIIILLIIASFPGFFIFGSIINEIKENGDPLRALTIGMVLISFLIICPLIIRKALKLWGEKGDFFKVFVSWYAWWGMSALIIFIITSLLKLTGNIYFFIWIPIGALPLIVSLIGIVIHIFKKVIRKAKI